MATEVRRIKPGALPRDIQQMGVRPAGSTDDLYLVANPASFRYSPQVVTDSLRSGGRTTDTASVVTSYDFETEIGGEPLHVLAVMLGTTVDITGSAPNRVATLKIKTSALPYFEIHTVSRADGGGNLLSVLEQAVLGGLGQDRDYGSFARLPVNGTCVAPETVTDGTLGYARAIEGSYDLAGIAEQTVEWAHRPFGSRKMAVAATLAAGHVWDYYAWAVPDMFTGSSTAATDGSKTAISLQHPYISGSTLTLSKNQDLSSPITSAQYTVSTTVSSSASAAAIAGVGIGITVPTTGILPGTLRITRAETGGAGDYAKEDLVTISPDVSGMWTYRATGTHAGSVVAEGITAGDTIYYQYELAEAKVVFESAAGVGSGNTVYYRYTPCQELVTRHLDELASLRAYAGHSTTGDTPTDHFAAASLIQQRGLAAHWLDDGDPDYSGRVWVDSALTGQNLAAGAAFSLAGTGIARRYAPILYAQGGTASLSITTYPLTANDIIARFAAQVDMATVEASSFGLDFPVNQIVENQAAITTGTTGSHITELRLRSGYPRPYFTLVRQAESANGGSARDIFLRAKLSTVDQTLADSEFLGRPLTSECTGDDRLGPTLDVVQIKRHYETTTPINIARI